MKKHRIFIAINLPENIKKKLADCREKWSELTARWAKLDNIHITLAFLGYISDEEMPEVCKALEETVSKYNSFDINLNKICYGPLRDKSSGQAPRMVWAIGEKISELSLLKKELDEKLGVFENREFAPHITLARISQWAWQRIEPEERPEINEDINLSFTVNSIEIMESILKKGGPEYVILESYNLNL
jgi:2'-5' RNA ligase